MNWTISLADGNMINVMEMRTNQASLETVMDIADTNFEKETGSKYSSWMGKRTPWREPIDEEISTEEQIEKPIVTDFEKEKEIISKSSSAGVRKLGDKTIRELSELDKQISSYEKSIAIMEKDWKSLTDRKDEVNIEIKNLMKAFKGIDMPKDVLEKRKKLVLEYNDLKERTKTVGSYYQSSPLGRINKAKKDLKNLREQETTKKSRLSKLIKVR